MILSPSLTKCRAALALAFVLTALPRHAWAAPGDKARITGLADVAFGTLNTASDQSISENVCAFSNSATGGYSVTATGSGGSGAFTLASGGSQLPYEVSWAGSANQSNGTALTSGTLISGFTSAATQQSCNSGPAASASLTVIIRAASLGSAMAGPYSGTLQITIAPE